MPAAPTPPVALDKAYALSLWLIPKIGSMPRTHRFTLGDRIYSQSLDLVTALTSATFSREKSAASREKSAASREKSAALTSAADSVNSLRLLLRLAKDLGLFAFDSYSHAASLLDEIGRMVGGWRKSQ